MSKMDALLKENKGLRQANEKLIKLVESFWYFLRDMPRNAESVVTKMHVENVLHEVGVRYV